MEHKMKKNAFKFIIDVLLFIDICSISAIGLLLGFVIPKGNVHPAGNRFLGLHRHEWGDIHLTLGLFLAVLLILHLSLNWSWIIHSCERYFGTQWKNFLYLLSGAWFILLVLFWIIKTLG
jgi:hypothetical protein